MTVASEVGGAAQVRAEVNYIRNPPAAADEVLEFVTEAEERSTMRTRPGREMWITNARSLTTDLDREGFVLVPHTSSVANFDEIQEDAAVDQQYIDEMTELLRRVTGASRAFMLGGGSRPATPMPTTPTRRRWSWWR